jgi:hypothetical protein
MPLTLPVVTGGGGGGGGVEELSSPPPHAVIASSAQEIKSVAAVCTNRVFIVFSSELYASG